MASVSIRFAPLARSAALLLALAGAMGSAWADGYRGRGHGWYGHSHWRPHVGLHVHGLPALRSVVVIGGISYLLAQGVYYREHPEGGWVVVPPPMMAADMPQPAPAEPPRQFVYPRQGQTAPQQSADEYDCHRWAVGQAGFDPASAALGHSAGEGRRGDYLRARSACLEGRGYTVR